jgi:hypothetical protein
MSPMLIQCECGQRVEGEDEPAVLAAAHEHIAARHPDLVDRLSDEDLRRMVHRQ